MLTRRAALFRAAGLAAAPLLVTAAKAEEVLEISQAIPADLSSLPRRKQALVAPPFVHEHEQVASGGPAIVEFEMDIVEKEVQIAADAWLQAMTFDGSMPGPIMVVHEGDYVELTLRNPRHEPHAAQHRLPLVDRRAGRRGADPRQPGRAGGAALEGHAARRLRLPLRAGRPDDPLARRVGHVGRHHGPAARRAEGRQGPPGRLRPRLLHRGERLLHPEGRDRRLQPLCRRGRRLHGHGGGDEPPDAHPRHLQRRGRRADGRQRAEGQRGRAGALHPQPGEPRHAART